MDEVKLQLRLAPDLHERLVVAAREAERSLNSELNYRLRAALSAGDGLALRAKVAEQARALRAMERLDGGLAGMLLAAVKLLRRQGAQDPEVAVWEAIAETIVNGPMDGLAEALAPLLGDGGPLSQQISDLEHRERQALQAEGKSAALQIPRLVMQPGQRMTDAEDAPAILSRSVQWQLPPDELQAEPAVPPDPAKPSRAERYPTLTAGGRKRRT